MARKSIATELIEFLGTLKVTEGPLYGEPFPVFPWQKRFIRAVFKPGIYRAALSVARENGKTSLTAAIAAASLVGPLARPGGQTVIVASSLDQGKIPFRHVVQFCRPWTDENPKDWSIIDSSNRAEMRQRSTGNRLTVKGSDPRRAHGMAPNLVLCDEVAQWELNKSEAMLAALRTALGKQADAKIIALGTRPADPSNWFQKWLDGDAQVSACYAAGEKDLIDRRATWHKANPSLKHMPWMLAAMEDAWAEAQNSTEALQSFKALKLNMGISDVHRAALLDAGAWRQLEDDNPGKRGPCVWGADLGATAAMSSVAGYWPETGWLEVVGAFPEHGGLAKRGDRDGVGDLYVKMQQRGELITTPGRTVHVPTLIAEALFRFGPPAAVAADRWREGELLDALEAVGVPPAAFIPRGQGYRDGAEDVRRFRRAAEELRIRTPESLMMRAAMGGAVVMTDPAGNSKIAKHGDGTGRNARHRDDAVVAGVMAVAEGDRGYRPETPPEDEQAPETAPVAYRRLYA